MAILTGRNPSARPTAACVVEFATPGPAVAPTAAPAAPARTVRRDRRRPPYSCTVFPPLDDPPRQHGIPVLDTRRDHGHIGGDALVTVESRWTDPETGSPDEDSAIATASTLASSLDLAPTRLRQDVFVAAFAEVLRRAPWAGRVTTGALAENIAALSRTMPSDRKVAELAALASAAADLSG